MNNTTIDSYYPTSKEDWRKWLQENHQSKEAVWLICYKKSANKPTISWSDAVDEALCFGWIDSIRISLDDERYQQFFSRRKAKSAWSKINKDKVAQLIAKGLMMPAGLASIETAKQNGSWSALDDVEALTIPDDLAQAFTLYINAKDYFLSLSKSIQKRILQWIAFAKRPETRQKRIAQVAETASKKTIPAQV